VPRLIPSVVPDGTLRDRPQPVLQAGSRFTLRPWRAADAPIVAAAYDDPEIQQWHHRTMSRDEASEWVAATAARWSAERDAEWAVVDGEGVVGRVALRGIELAAGQAELSYWTLPRARRQGVASRAVSRIATWALEEVGLWRLEVRHSTRNDPSCRVATRAGFRWEAQLARQQLHADGWHDVHLHTRFREGTRRG
jgi:[ribosomal protein S5]-alanine N-acetyltransferase